MNRLANVAAFPQFREIPDACGKCGGTYMRWCAQANVTAGELSPELSPGLVLLCGACDAPVKLVECADLAEFLNEQRAEHNALAASGTDDFVPFRLRLIGARWFQAGSTAFTLSAGAIVTVKQVDRTLGKVLIDFGDGQIDWLSQVTVRSYFDKVLDDEQDEERQ